MKVAIIHDWLTGLRGGERCLQAFLDLYPDADIFTLLHVPGSTTPSIDRRVKATSCLQKIPGVRRFYRLLLPLYPRAAKGFDLRGYDLVISLSHAAAKNVEVPEGVPHVCYCFTPMRYIWDQAYNYFGVLTRALWPILSALRSWDRRGAARTTVFVAISRFVAARIRCFYGREAEVIYPPTDTSWIRPSRQGRAGEAFLYAGALVSYKKPDLVVKAFNKLGLPLWIVGRGPMEAQLRKMAGPNIRFFGYVPDVDLASYYRKCRALVFPGTEDFGMVPVECMAAGRPVIALHDGALKESLNGIKPWQDDGLAVEDASGVFINKNGDGELEELVRSLRYFIDNEARFQASACLAQAAKFSPLRFRNAWNTVLVKHGLARFAVRASEGGLPISRQIEVVVSGSSGKENAGDESAADALARVNAEPENA